MDKSLPIIALGTTNEAKRKAVKLATGVEPICQAVPSEVSDQPLSEEETVQGAINRAKNVLTAVPEASIGLGLEGGLHFDPLTNQWYLLSICAAWNGQKIYVGKGLYLPVPNQIGEKVSIEGLELRLIIDELSGTSGSNHKGGAYALFTDGRLTRADVFKETVIAALTPFHSSLYL